VGKYIIDGREYPAIKSLDDVTLATQMTLERSTGMTRADVDDLFKRVAAMSETEAYRSDDALIAFGIGVWFARRAAGESLSLEAACDVPMSKVQYVVEPGDPTENPLPGGSPDPTRRAGSARPGTRSPQDRKPKSAKAAASAKKTSKKPSSSGS